VAGDGVFLAVAKNGCTINSLNSKQCSFNDRYLKIMGSW
jgi:hypothetical protein